MSEDVKRLLARAVGPEPPLSLDREALYRLGRRRVRARRLAATGGVAASVVAVVLGAVALAGLNGPNPSTVGQAGTPPAPPTSTVTSAVAPSTSPALTMPPPPPDVLAPALTKALSEAPLIPRALEIRPLSTRIPLTFGWDGGGYYADAELVDRSGRGYLAIQVRDTNGALPPAACPPDPTATRSCVIADDHGYDMVLLTERLRSGEVLFLVRTVKRDGTEISATATNADARTRVVTRKEPPLGFEVLTELVALPRLTVR